MTLSSIKLFQNKLVYSGCMLMFFLNNCTSTQQYYSPKIDVEQWVEEYNVCRGKGKLISTGRVNGRLSFTYTCVEKDVFIHFKDIIGRKTMLIILRQNSVEAWDMMQNIRFSTESIYLRFPFFEVLKPMDLISIFWGIEPEGLHKSQPNKSMTESEIDIRFSSDGLDLQTVLINMDDKKQSIEMTFVERELGSAYPHLIKQIPESIPRAQS